MNKVLLGCPRLVDTSSSPHTRGHHTRTVLASQTLYQHQGGTPALEAHFQGAGL